MLAIGIFCVSEKHIWHWDWSYGFHAGYNCQPVKDINGRKVEAWRWVEGREIRLYVPDDMSPTRVDHTAEGIRSLVRDLNLDLHLRVLPLDSRTLAALQRSSQGTGRDYTISFNRLCRNLIATRTGQYAEVIVVKCILDGAADTMGMANFTYGVSLIDERCACGPLARHETGHLLGYHMHDNLPFIVFGYSNPQWGKIRQGKESSLMMPAPDSTVLSARSRDALLSFWESLSRRTGQSYFRQ